MSSHKQCNALSTFFKFFSNPLRLKIICAISSGEKTVTEIVQFCDASKFNVSQQLKFLKLAGIVGTKKDGKFTYCTLKNKRIHALLRSISKSNPGQLLKNC